MNLNFNNIGIFTSNDDILLPYLIDNLKKIKNIKIILIILKSKKTNHKNYLKNYGIYFTKKKQNINNTEGIKRFYVNSFNSKICLDVINDNEIKYIYNSLNYRKISNKIINSCKKIINIQDGLLPYYNGANCLEWTLINNDPIAISAYFLEGDLYNSSIIEIKKIKFDKKEIKNYFLIKKRITLEILNLAYKILYKLNKNYKFKTLKYDKRLSKTYNKITIKKFNILKKNILNHKFSLNINNIKNLKFTGKKIIIKKFQQKDITSQYINWLNDKRVVKFSNQRFIKHNYQSSINNFFYYESGRHFFLKILSKSNNEFIGTLTFKFVNNAIDIGIMIGNKKYWNMGIGFDVWNTSIKYIFNKLKQKKITGGCKIENFAMRRILEKSNMKLISKKTIINPFTKKSETFVYYEIYDN